MHYLLIRGIVGFDYQDEFFMLSALMCMGTYWTGPAVRHDIRLSSSYDFTKFLYRLSFNFEITLSLC